MPAYPGPRGGKGRFSVVSSETAKVERAGWSTRAVAEAAAMIALSVVLYLIKIYHLPQGGSVTAGSMIPILFLAWRRGPAIGMVAGAAFGLIQYLIEPFFVHPVQFLLDYPLAISALGLAGFFRRWPLVGVVVALAGRFLCHFASGVVFFGSYAPQGVNPAVYSVIYNGSYLLPELVISLVITYFLVRKLGPLPQR